MSALYGLFAVAWLILTVAQLNIAREWRAAPDNHARGQATAARVMATTYFCAAIAFAVLAIRATS